MYKPSRTEAFLSKRIAVFTGFSQTSTESCGTRSDSPSVSQTTPPARIGLFHSASEKNLIVAGEFFMSGTAQASPQRSSRITSDKQMDNKEVNDPLTSVTLIKDDLTKSNLDSSSDSEKIIQHLNDELQEAQGLANSEKRKCMELQGILQEERKENKHQADESAKQMKLLQGQLQQLQGEIGVLRGQLDASPGLHDELQRARDETKALNRALEAAAAERDRDVTAVQMNLSAATKDLEQWRQTANKYQQQIKDLERDVQQQSIQWQKTAEIQASELQSMQVECNGLLKECSALRSEKQDVANKHQKEKSGLQSECASLRAEKEDLLKTQQRENAGLQDECTNLRSGKEAALLKQQQLEKDLASLRSQNAELGGSVKALESSQEELEKRLAAVQLQHQQDNAKLQTQLDEADSHSKALERENEDTKAELSDLKEKYEKAEQEKQALSEELEDCKANMKDLAEKGTKKPWMIWGPVVAVALTAVTAAALLRT
ncbi:sarcolemma associated protein b isoform X2 [Nelusetta ayraudi]|uniref:sarcolemma associated protein b isoform X2 n=1 Tax=Nelusetta ayraudi TaxID=303726 RepID=UPI003F71B186